MLDADLEPRAGFQLRAHGGVELEAQKVDRRGLRLVAARQVLIRMRQKVENNDLVAAFKSDGYKAWYDPKVAILQSDAVYRKK